MRRRKRSKKLRVLNLWLHQDAAKAVPYLRSLTGSLREHWLQLLQAQRRLKARPNGEVSRRDRFIQQEKLEDDCDRAQERFEDALEELNKVEVYLLDPVRGLALIPFRKEDDLAWFVFDYFAPQGLVGWRYHQDEIDACRPLETLEATVSKA
jgi:hypothetical protein